MEIRAAAAGITAPSGEDKGTVTRGWREWPPEAIQEAKLQAQGSQEVQLKADNPALPHAGPHHSLGAWRGWGAPHLRGERVPEWECQIKCKKPRAPTPP